MTMKPILAADVTDFSLMRYPVYGSPKIDGVRALMLDRFRPRSLKLFPNVATRDHFDRFIQELATLDGELRVGPLNAADMCRATSSALATVEGDPQAVWHVFDVANPDLTFEERLRCLRRHMGSLGSKKRKEMRIELVEHTLIRSAAEAEAFEHEKLARGYEGVVWRSPTGLYKYGRGTMRDQTFMRTKRFEDAEGRVIGFNELMRNGNEAKVNELGHQVRSHHQANKTGGEQLGALVLKVVTGPLKGQTFELGTGFTEAQRIQLWVKRHELHDRLVKFRYFAHGVKDKPRWPSFQGFREGFDL
jgi:DNA ligase-1